MKRKIFTPESARIQLALIAAEMQRRKVDVQFEWLDKQKDAVKAIEEARHYLKIPRLLYGGALGGGKSFFLCRYAVENCEKYPGARWYICRKEVSSFMRTTYLTLVSPYPDGVEILDRPGWHQSISQKYFWNDNGSRIDYGGLGGDKKDIDKVKSMTLSSCAIDEASEVELQFALMLVGRCGRIPSVKGTEAALMASNPDDCWLIGHFLEEPRPGWVYVPSLLSDNKYATDAYRENVEDAFASVPDMKAALLHGDWKAITVANRLFPTDLVEAAIAKETTVHGFCQLGVDVAGEGKDKTVIVGRWGEEYHILEEIATARPWANAEAIKAQAIKHNAQFILVDDVTLGAGVTDILVKMGMPVIPVIANGRAILKPQRFADFKTEYAWDFRARLELNQAKIPNHPELKEQLCSIRYITETGKNKLEPKKILKARLHCSPDHMDALLLASIDLHKYIQPEQTVHVGQDESFDLGVNIWELG